MNEQVGEELPGIIENGEKLARDERSQRSARRAYRKLKTAGRAYATVDKFTPLRGTNEISVNRMGLTAITALAELGTQNAKRLDKKFWGWYTLASDDVEKVGCRVKPTPFSGNPYHADIVIPVALDAEDRRDALVQYAHDLACHAIFEPWGEWAG